MKKTCPLKKQMKAKSAKASKARRKKTKAKTLEAAQPEFEL